IRVDCARLSAGPAGWCSRAASRPPESRRLRPSVAPPPLRCLPPPHAPRNRDDCDVPLHCCAGDREIRLTPPGIATTATNRCYNGLSSRRAASRPPESRRLRLDTVDLLNETTARL